MQKSKDIPTSAIENLLPELRNWNGGNGIDITGWLFCIARTDIALAYIHLFWPKFQILDDYVLRADIKPESLEKWRNTGKYSRSSIEEVLNCINILDYLSSNSDETNLLKERAKVIGIYMQEMYSAKLKIEYPDRRFSVVVNGLDSLSDYIPITLSFWQVS